MDPILTTIAAALAKEAVTAGKTALAALVKRVREKFGQDPGSEIVLASARENPDDEKWTAALAKVLDRTGQTDPRFAADLLKLWEAAKPEVTTVHVEQTAGDGGVNNSITGNVSGSVVQARDITGGINLR
jgi:hypothetical protein